MHAELAGACHLHWPGWAGTAPLRAIKPRGAWESWEAGAGGPGPEKAFLKMSHWF